MNNLKQIDQSNQNETTPENHSIEENRKNILYTLESEGELDLKDAMEVKQVSAYLLVKNLFPDIENDPQSLSTIEKDPLCEKYLAKDKYLNQHHEEIRSKINSREWVDYVELEKNLKGLLQDINHYALREVATNSTEKELNSFKQNIEKILDETTKFAYSEEIIDQILSLKESLKNEDKKQDSEYLACYSIRVGMENLLEKLLAEYQEDEEITIDLLNLRQKLEADQSLKTVEFSEEIDLILNARLKERLLESAETDFGRKMTEFIQQNYSYKKLWSKFENGEKISKKEFKEFALNFGKFAGMATLMILVSTMLLGCGSRPDNDNRDVFEEGYDYGTRPAYDKNGKPFTGYYVDGDNIDKEIFDRPDQKYAAENGAEIREYKGALGVLANKIQTQFEKNNPYYDPHIISSELRNVIVIPNLEFSLRPNYAGIGDGEKVDIYISIKSNSGDYRWTKINPGDVFRSDSPIIKLKAEKSGKEFVGMTVNIKYNPPAESNEPGVISKTWDYLFR